MAAKVTAKLALDTRGFNAGLKRARASLNSIGKAGAAAGLVAVAAGFTAVAVGMKKAIDLGGQLSDLADQTGVAAGDLYLLQTAFEQNGIAASKAAQKLNKMQKAIVEGKQGLSTYVRAFDMMGVSLESLDGKDAMDQFKEIGAAINAMPSATERAAVALQVFGGRTAELLTLFANPVAMEKAVETLGSQVELLNKNAKEFDKASDILGQVGKKLQGFFVGMASQVVTELMPALEAANKLDFAQQGQAVGKEVALQMRMISNGDWIDSMFLKLAAGLHKLVNNVATLIIQVIGGVIKSFELLNSDEFWSGLKRALQLASVAFARTILMAVADTIAALREIPGLAKPLEGALDYAINGADDLGAVQMGIQADGKGGLGESVGNVASMIADKFLQGATVPPEMETWLASGVKYYTDADKALRDRNRIEMAEERAAAIAAAFGKDKDKIPIPIPIPPVSDELPSTAADTAAANTAGVIAASLQQVGGGGAFARFSDTANPAAQAVQEQKTTNKLLAKNNELLEANFGRISGGGGVVLAY